MKLKESQINENLKENLRQMKNALKYNASDIYILVKYNNSEGNEVKNFFK